MKNVLVLRNGYPPDEIRPFYGDFEDQLLRPLGLARRDALVVDMPRREPLPDIDAIAGILITGSLSMLTDHEPWMEVEAAWLREVLPRAVPTLGVCFGHQMLAYAMGGRVDYNSAGPEVGTVTIDLAEAAGSDPLFHALPPSVAVQTSHSQSVSHLPEGAVLLAGNAHDGHHAFRIGECAWGVQFHPEWDGALTRRNIEVGRDWLLEVGQDPDALRSVCRDTPLAGDVLRNFGRFVRECL